MTLGNFLSQMGIGTKHLTERYSHGEYGAPMHDSHMIYAYEPPPSHGHPVASSKHHHGGGGHKSSAAMSALTLLAFLFFLHILQQCLKDHMMSMSTPPVVVMTGGREGEEIIHKSNSNKLDKSGITTAETKNNPEINVNAKTIDGINAKYPSNDALDSDLLMKVDTAEHTPKLGAPKYKRVYKHYGNRTLSYSGFGNEQANY